MASLRTCTALVENQIKHTRAHLLLSYSMYFILHSIKLTEDTKASIDLRHNEQHSIATHAIHSF